MSGYGIMWLRESKANHSDGTFWSAPKFFFQFYVIFGQKNLMILPCVYAALPNKKAETYEEDIAASELVDAQISQADSNFDSFNINSQDGFKDLSDEEDDDDFDDDFDDDPYDDLDEFNPHRETESRYPQISQPQSNEAIDEDQISNIEQLENLLQPSNSIATAVITNLCIVCSTQVNAGSFIACSNCFY